MRRAAAAMLVLVGLALLAGCAGPTVSPGAQCLAWLDGHGAHYTPADPGQQDNPRCWVDTPVRLRAAGGAAIKPAMMSCYLAARLDAFERNVVPQLAAAELGQRVTRIEHLGAYSCRRSTGQRNRLSEHAFGLAIDISGFRLADGSRVSVEHDWWPAGPKRNFLLHVARSACSYFSVVLTPTSNRDHFNHMHFDLGPSRLCSV